MLNNKRKYFLYTHLFFKVLNSKRNECIFQIKFIIVSFIELKFLE